MNDTASEPAIVHNLALHRFEASVAGGVAHTDYRQVGDTLHMVHTEVPPAAEGKGVAGALVEAALDFAERNHLKVLPSCPYVRGYMQRHPETHPLLAPGTHL